MDDDDYTGSDAAAIIDAVEKYHTVEFHDVEDPTPNSPRKIASVPKGMTLLSLKPLLDVYRQHPERKFGRALLSTLESFIAHVEHHKRPESAVFAQLGTSHSPGTPQPQRQLVAVYDYHEANTGLANFGQHRAIYPFPLSDEWIAWERAAARTDMSQQQFAEFLEDRITDVVSPGDKDIGIQETYDQLGLSVATPAQLLTLSRNLKIRVDCEVTQKATLSSGEVELAYKETHSGSDTIGLPLKIPGAFLIAIPVFQDDVRYRLGVRLRYRVQGGKVAWSIILHRADIALHDAMTEACERVGKETQLPLFYGIAEEPS